MNFTRLVILCLAVTSFVLSTYYPADCAEPGKKVSSEEGSPSSKRSEALERRVQEYWNLKIHDDLAKAYAYEDPDSLKGVKLTDYIKKTGSGVRLLGAEVGNTEINGNDAKVTVILRYLWTFTSEAPEKGFKTPFFDFWTYRNNNWYHIYRSASKSTFETHLKDPAKK